MARPKGSRNKKKLSRPASQPPIKAPSFDAHQELIQLYKSIKTTPKTMQLKFEILKTLKGG